MERSKTERIKLGSTYIGGSDKVLIQSMCSIKTSLSDEVIAQIRRCKDLGADLMRCSCLDFEDARAFKAIKEAVDIPIVADIHFDYHLALAAIESGVDKVRINPGNIGSIDKIHAVVEACSRHNVPIRIGVNGGSLDKTLLHLSGAEALVSSAKKHVAILEEMNFRNIVVSLKGSSVLETIEAYRIASRTFPYPLHLGVTEAGTKDVGLLRSAAALSPLLLEGIGNTIRISLSEPPEEEIKAACRLLHDIGLYPDYPTFISCPTCGRTEVDLMPLADKVQKYLESVKKPITVAVMGCIVNGPGEASHADIGIAGGRGSFVLFKKGKMVASLKEEEAFEVLKKEIDSF